MTPDEPIRIGISGSYGGLNLGDEAILAGILAGLRATLRAEITVFTRNASDTLARHEVEQAVQIRRLTRKEAREEVARLDLFILGGGGILYDSDADAYLREVSLAHDLSIPVVVYAISAGPLDDPGAQMAVAKCLNRARLVTVRDLEGYRLLEEVGVETDIHLTADPALLTSPEAFPTETLVSEGVHFGRPLVGFSVREPGPAAPDISVDHYYELLANAADFLIDRHGADVVFVPMERADIQHSHGVVAKMEFYQSAEVLRRNYSAGEALGLVGLFEFCVGMRLHFLVFSALQKVPFVALPYASKVMGFIGDMAFPMPPLHHVEAGSLIASIDRAWDTRTVIRAQIDQNLPKLKQRARATNELLLQVIEETWGRGAFRKESGDT